MFHYSYRTPLDKGNDKVGVVVYSPFNSQDHIGTVEVEPTEIIKTMCLYY